MAAGYRVRGLFRRMWDGGPKRRITMVALDAGRVVIHLEHSYGVMVGGEEQFDRYAWTEIDQADVPFFLAKPLSDHRDWNSAAVFDDLLSFKRMWSRV